MQVRNRGTIGGSLVHADPAADWPAVFLALDGEATLVGPKGERTIRAASSSGMLTSAVQEREMLTEVSFPVPGAKPAPPTRSCASPRRASRSSAWRPACAPTAPADRRARIGVTGVNPVPFRARALEKRLGGQAVSGPALRALCAAIDEADPMEDMHASADYRRHLFGVFAARTIERAIQRAQV